MKEVVVRKEKDISSKEGRVISLDKNEEVIIDNKKEKIGKSILGKVKREMREKKKMKIIQMDKEVI